jgi:hypothetical protein
MRVPKLHGFKNRFRVEYAVVNLGSIEAALTNGRLEPGPKSAPATVNAELLYGAGLLGRVNLPLKILGGGELTHPLLAIADAFSAEARRKIEAAGGTAMTLEVPEAPPTKAPRARPAIAASASTEAVAPAPAEGPEPEVAAEATAATEVVETKPARRTRKASAPAAADATAADSTSAAARPEATSAAAVSDSKPTPSEAPPKPARRPRTPAPEPPAAAEAPEAPEAAESTESPESPA